MSFLALIQALREEGIPVDGAGIQLHCRLKQIVEQYCPESAAIEKLYFTKNTKTAIDVAKSIGVVLLTIKFAGIEYSEYSPLQVKQAITGYGKASKEQMQEMIKKLFKLSSFPFPDDTADALAIAACHSLSLALKRRLNQ